jgi:serine/threonine protein kinase
MPRTQTKRYNRKKARTITMKMKGGKKFEGVSRISSGAEGVAYLTADKKLLKVMKRGINITDEINLHKKLNELRLPYFPKFLGSGRAVSRNEINLSNTTLSGLFNNTGNYPYTYVLMEFVEGGKEFPKYLSDKIEEIIPGKTRPLTAEELEIVVNIVLNIFTKMTFALYVADKVFNYRHNDLNDRNCLIRPNGDPVIIDFGSNRFQYNNIRNNNSGKNSWGYFNKITVNRTYSEQKMKQYVNQIRQHPKISRFFELATFVYPNPISIEKVAVSLLSAKTGEAVKPFDYMKTFTELGIDKSELARAGMKIKYRETRLAPPRTLDDEIANAKQILGALGFPEELVNEKIQEAIEIGILSANEIAEYVATNLLGA